MGLCKLTSLHFLFQYCFIALFLILLIMGVISSNVWGSDSRYLPTLVESCLCAVPEEVVDNYLFHFIQSHTDSLSESTP